MRIRPTRSTCERLVDQPADKMRGSEGSHGCQRAGPDARLDAIHALVFGETGFADVLEEVFCVLRILKKKEPPLRADGEHRINAKTFGCLCPCLFQLPKTS